MGGRYYTAEENERLRKFIEMNPGVNDTELARRVLDLGIIYNRSVQAIAQQIRVLKSADEKPATETDDNQLEWNAIMSFQYRKDFEELKTKYDSLLNVLIDLSDIKVVESGNATYKNLYFQYVELNRWIRENEPLRLAERLEASEYKED